MKKAIVTMVLLIFVVGGLYTFINFWPYIFVKTVQGEVIKVERLMEPVAVLSRDGEPSNKVFSFAVAVKDQATGEIFTASTEDRQWAAVQGEGLCARAKFFPYPPWQFDKAGTYHGARLIKLWKCDEKLAE